MMPPLKYMVKRISPESSFLPGRFFLDRADVYKRQVYFCKISCPFFNYCFYTGVLTGFHKSIVVGVKFRFRTGYALYHVFAADKGQIRLKVGCGGRGIEGGGNAGPCHGVLIVFYHMLFIAGGFFGCACIKVIHGFKISLISHQENICPYPVFVCAVVCSILDYRYSRIIKVIVFLFKTMIEYESALLGACLLYTSICV